MIIVSLYFLLLEHQSNFKISSSASKMCSFSSTVAFEPEELLHPFQFFIHRFLHSLVLLVDIISSNQISDQINH